MTRTLFALILLLAMADGRADGPRGPHQPPPAFAELAHMLELTEAQREPVRNQLSAHREKMRAVETGNHNQRETLQEANRQELAKLLSAEQLQRFDEMAAQRHARGQRRPPDGNAAGGAGRGPHGDHGPRDD
jgi:hypothetical protein